MPKYRIMLESRKLLSNEELEDIITYLHNSGYPGAEIEKLKNKEA